LYLGYLRFDLAESPEFSDNAKFAALTLAALILSRAGDYQLNCSLRFIHERLAADAGSPLVGAAS